MKLNNLMKMNKSNVSSQTKTKPK